MKMSGPDRLESHPAAAPADAGFAQVAELATRISARQVQELHTTRDATHYSSWRTRMLVVLAWLATLVLGVLVVLRIFYHDGTHVLTWINAFTRYVYLPAYVCLMLAMWNRRRWLMLANMAIIGCQLFWVAPDFLRNHQFDAPAAATGADAHARHKLRVFFANVRASNREQNAMLQEIKEANPDVIVLVEFFRPWRTEFVQSPLMAAYPYGSGWDLARVGDVSMYSKVPIKADSQVWIADRCVETIEIAVGSQTLRLAGLHAPRPMDFHHNDYDGYWNRVVPLLLGDRHPLVVVGDCNATQYSQVYERLKAGGLRSAHEDRGRGYATTWPNGEQLVPPIRIDQAFLSSDVACLDISEGRGLGSDHKPLILDIELQDRPQSGAGTLIGIASPGTGR